MDKRNLLDDEMIALLESRDLNIRSLMDGMFGGKRRSAYYGTSMEFADFREYAPGDDIRRIDWNLYGRLDKLYLKLFTDERRQHHRIYIDCSASMAWGKPEKHLTALRLAALIGYLAVSGMDKVSWYALEGNGCRSVTDAVSSRDALFTGLERLGEVQCGGETDIEASVASSPSPGYHDGISFIISDLLTDSDWKAAVDWLLYKKQEVCVIQVLSRDEMVPALSGKLYLMDSEAETEDDSRNRRMNIGRQRMLAYAAAYEWLENDIKSFCDKRQVRFFSVPTDEKLSRMLFDKAIRSEMIQ